MVFVPFLGDFFSMETKNYINKKFPKVFVPFLGDFFSMGRKSAQAEIVHLSTKIGHETKKIRHKN